MNFPSIQVEIVIKEKLVGARTIWYGSEKKVIISYYVAYTFSYGFSQNI